MHAGFKQSTQFKCIGKHVAQNGEARESTLGLSNERNVSFSEPISIPKDLSSPF